MTWQEPVAAIIVVAATAYLVWKFGFASRPRSRKKPDVPLSALTRKRKAK